MLYLHLHPSTNRVATPLPVFTIVGDPDSEFSCTVQLVIAPCSVVLQYSVHSSGPSIHVICMKPCCGTSHRHNSESNCMHPTADLGSHTGSQIQPNPLTCHNPGEGDQGRLSNLKPCHPRWTRTPAKKSELCKSSQEVGWHQTVRTCTPVCCPQHQKGMIQSNIIDGVTVQHWVVTEEKISI